MRRIPLGLSLGVGVVALLSTAPFRIVAATPAAPDPFAFFEPSVTVTSEDRMDIDDGRPVARIIPGKEHEVGVWAAVPVTIGADRLVEWMRRIEDLKKSSYVQAIGRFSDPPRLDDLTGLVLDDQDISDIAACRPGHCKLKLSPAEMTALQSSGPQDGSIQQRFRQMVLDRVNAYLSGGRIGPYADRDGEVWPDEEFKTLLDHSPFLAGRAPSFAQSLREVGAAPAPGAESFLYWSKERLGGKASIDVTDLHILRGGDAGLPEVIVAAKQIFATHYVDASLGLTFLVRGEADHANYLLYVNRSAVDLLHGTIGGVTRWVIQRRLRADADMVLLGLKHRLESAEPPRVAVTATP